MIALVKSQPQDNGEPVFDAPWQARSFAMAVKLHAAGLFTWQEWSDRLARAIAERESQDEVRDSNDYYTLWQETLEQLVRERVAP